MDKKLAFRLNFIKNYVFENLDGSKRIKKKRKTKLKEGFFKLLQETFSVEHFIDPIKCYRTNGDMIFFDSLDSDIEYFSFPKLRISFQKISLIQKTDKFITAFYESNDPFYTKTGLLIERLNSLGNANAHEFASELTKAESKLRSLDFVIKNELCSNDVPDFNNTNAVKEILALHEKDPIFTFHYIKSANIGLKICKYAINNIAKNLTKKDDVSIFESSVFLCPSKDYFNYTIELLKFFFNGDNTNNFYYYLNTAQGIKKCSCKYYSLWVNNDGRLEKILIIVFPKQMQTPEVQMLYDMTNEEIESEKKNEFLSEKAIKNMDGWKSLMGKYYGSMLKNKLIEKNKRRCQYKLIINHSEKISKIEQ